MALIEELMQPQERPGFTLLIPMAGSGKRFSDAGFKTPKPSIKVGGRTILEWSLSSFDKLYIGWVVFVVKSGTTPDEIKEIFRACHCVGQYVSVTIVEEEGPLMGQATSVLVGLVHGRITGPVIVANCDQIFGQDPIAFEQAEFLGGTFIPTFLPPPENRAKWSYVIPDLVRDGRILGTVEKPKVPPSEEAIVGVFAHASAENLKDGIRTMVSMGNRMKVNGEYYLAPVFNLFDKSEQKFARTDMMGLGTPEDLDVFCKKHNLPDWRLENK